MKTLFIDTSTSFLVVAIIENQDTLFFIKQEGKNNHSDHLLNQIQMGLKQTNLDFQDMEQIIVAIGPGAYTGLRVSLTVAKMLSWTLQIPLYTISSLDSLASHYLLEDGIYIISMRAKKEYVFASVVEIKNGLKNVLFAETYMEIKAFEALKASYPNALSIDEQAAKWDITHLDPSFFQKQDEVHLLEPNYLRGEV